jgi:hypothetical protein
MKADVTGAKTQRNMISLRNNNVFDECFARAASSLGLLSDISKSLVHGAE